jgi:thymidylate synthase
MATVSDRYVDAESLSEGWLEAVRLLRHVGGKRKVVHLIVRIRKPDIEDAAIRKEAQKLIDTHNKGKAEDKQLGGIETVRNTIFPAAWAIRRKRPADLAAHYCTHYTLTGLLGVGANKYGTYFGRIVAYPHEKGAPADQLTSTIEKLRDELAKHSNKSSCYEINVYNERLDQRRMGFPCLAHISIHQHEGALHLQAIYRNEFMIARGYGNYLGLAELQAYMATACDLHMGELMITAGHAELDTNMAPIDAMLNRYPPANQV